MVACARKLFFLLLTRQGYLIWDVSRIGDRIVKIPSLLTMYLTKIFGWIIALRWEVKIWWRNVWTSRQLAGYIQNFHRTMLNDRRHWKLKSFWSLGCPIWFSYFWMLPIGMFNLLLEETEKIQQRWQQKRETALNAKKKSSLASSVESLDSRIYLVGV